MENAQPEPSMEEILASIRRIISEDEEEAPAGATLAAETPEQAPTPARTKPELIQNNVTEVKASDEDGADPHLKTEDVEMIKKNVAAAVQQDVEDTMLDKSSAAAATQSFQNLSQTVRVSDGDGRTLEDIVIQMIQPMLKEWLDANLPAIVEEKVEEEVQRVARRRG